MEVQSLVNIINLYKTLQSVKSQKLADTEFSDQLGPALVMHDDVYFLTKEVKGVEVIMSFLELLDLAVPTETIEPKSMVAIVNQGKVYELSLKKTNVVLERIQDFLLNLGV